MAAFLLVKVGSDSIYFYLDPIQLLIYNNQSGIFQIQKNKSDIYWTQGNKITQKLSTRGKDKKLHGCIATLQIFNLSVFSRANVVYSSDHFKMILYKSNFLFGCCSLLELKSLTTLFGPGFFRLSKTGEGAGGMTHRYNFCISS